MHFALLRHKGTQSRTFEKLTKTNLLLLYGVEKVSLLHRTLWKLYFSLCAKCNYVHTCLIMWQCSAEQAVQPNYLNILAVSTCGRTQWQFSCTQFIMTYAAAAAGWLLLIYDPFFIRAHYTCTCAVFWYAQSYGYYLTWQSLQFIEM